MIGDEEIGKSSRDGMGFMVNPATLPALTRYAKEKFQIHEPLVSAL